MQVLWIRASVSRQALVLHFKRLVSTSNRITFCIIFHSIPFIFLYRNCAVKEWFPTSASSDAHRPFSLRRNTSAPLWTSNLTISVWPRYADKCRAVFPVLFWVFNSAPLIKKISKHLEGFSDIFFRLNKIKKNLIFYWIVKNLLIEKNC